MPVKVVPPVVQDEVPSLAAGKQGVGALTLMSGFMTKKTRTLNKWKQRWWQLRDDGYLFYFKNDNQLKALGQIDIARTCYDVRLGSDKCRVEFPRAAPSCCCISFAVLKRTYYVYTPTAGEAKRWAQALSTMSRVINRKIIAGVERRKAPDPPGGPYRPPSCPPDHRVKMTRVRMNNGNGTRFDSCEDFTRIEYVKRSNLKSTKNMATSVPNYLNKLDADDNCSISGSLGSRLWLDGSPPAVDYSSSPMRSASVADLTLVTNETHNFNSPPPAEKKQDLEESLTSSEENHQPKSETEVRNLYKRSVSVNNIISVHLGEEEDSEFQPRSNSLSTQEQRPVPKPRKGKALNSDSNHSSTSSLQPTPRPRTLSSSSTSSSKKRPSSLGMHPRKGSSKRKILSPPALPPPPPPSLQTPLLQPPSILLSPPELPRHSGPPKFIPPPPPQSPPAV